MRYLLKISNQRQDFERLRKIESDWIPFDSMDDLKKYIESSDIFFKYAIVRVIDDENNHTDTFYFTRAYTRPTFLVDNFDPDKRYMTVRHNLQYKTDITPDYLKKVNDICVNHLINTFRE